ncbi:MAG: hypothetical protein LBM73_00115 [Candidatus Nomurabacteria bacterium]|jgi:hypothetical protein|nr:hypothetical protein [Candidatus Nomurabacteria bacterium]
MPDGVDIRENDLRKIDGGRVLEILLKCHYTCAKTPLHSGNVGKTRNIIWASDSYAGHKPTEQIKIEDITDRTIERGGQAVIAGALKGLLIQPRAAKSKDEQTRRTKDKAEVFTPLNVVKAMNDAVDRAMGEDLPDGWTWRDFVRSPRLEITCGEAPFIVSRYDPLSGKIQKPVRRVGFLDRKLQVVSKYCDAPGEWLDVAREAFRASYGYEWAGDNLLLARENFLYSLWEFYRDKFAGADCETFAQFYKTIGSERVGEFAEVVSWNVWQMDGLKNTLPMDGGKFAVVMDWELGRAVKFADLLN